jgi:hypothetical protein
MRSSRFVLITGGGLIGVYALTMLINGIVLSVGNGGESVSGWVKAFAIIIPAIMLLGASICLIFREKLEDHWIASTIAQCELFMSVGLTVAFTAIVPDAVAAVYANLKNWCPIDPMPLLGVNPLWAAAQILVGLWLLCGLGISMADNEQKLPYLIVRTICLGAILFVWLPFLHSLGWINPTEDFPIPLFVFFCALYYPIFLFIRVLMVEDDEIKMLIVASLVGAAALIPYFFLVYLLSGLFILLYSFVLMAWSFVTQYTWLTILFLFCFLGIAPYAVVTLNASGQVVDSYSFEGFEGVKGIARILVVVAIIALIIFGIAKCSA